MFGGEGYIEIFSGEKAIGRIDRNSVVEDNNYVFNYTTQVSDIEFRLTKIQKVGTIEINNDKYIKESAAFDRTQVINFEKIESNINIYEKSDVIEDFNIQESTGKVEIKLEDTETRVDFSMDSNSFSTSEVNDINMKLTLKTNEEKYELFKNPTFEIEFPTAVENVEIKSVNLVYKNGLSIESYDVLTGTTGNKTLRVKLSGVQSEYKLDSTIDGTQVVINADVTINKLTPNGAAKVKVTYKNEVGTKTTYEKENKTAEEYEIDYTSRSGILKEQKVENFDQENKVLVNYEDEIQTVTIAPEGNEQKAKVTMTVVNNYKKFLQNVQIVGKIPCKETNKEDQSLGNTLNTTLAGSVISNGLVGKIYYSEEANPELDSTSWKENVTDFTNIKSFKFVVDNEYMYVGEKVQLSYEINIPENVGYNQKIYNLLTTYYTMNNEVIKDYSMTGLITEEKELEFEDTQTRQVEELISVGTQLQRGGVEIDESQEINEGQILRYNVIIKNTSNQEIRNVKVKASAENANSYYWHTFETISSSTDENVMTGEWKEDLDNSHPYEVGEFASILPGESKFFTYQVKVKQVNDDVSKVYGKILISADGIEEKEYQTIKNTIREAELSMRLTKAGLENLDNMKVYSNYPYNLNLIIKNLSDKDIENVACNIKLPKEIKFDSKMTELLEEVTTSTQEISEGSMVTVIVPKIAKGEERILTIYTSTEKMANEIESINTRIVANCNYNGKLYISNEYDRVIYQSEAYLKITYSSNRENGSKVNDGDEITYTINIENTGVVTRLVKFTDMIPYGLRVNSAEFISSEGKLSDINITDRYVGRDYSLKSKDKLTVNIGTTVDRNELRSNQSTIENKLVFIPGQDIDEINNIVFYIDPLQDAIDEEEEELDLFSQPVENNKDANVFNKFMSNSNSTQQTDNKDTAKNQNDNTRKTNDNVNNTNNTNEQTIKEVIKYPISGKVWLDTDRNGLYKNEKKLDNIEVRLYKIEKQQTISISDKNLIKTTKTKNGDYVFENVEPGQYVVVFNYDNTKYVVSAYQKDGKQTAYSSDVIEKQLKLSNENKNFGVSDIIEITDKGIVNLDMGLSEVSGFDMSINTYIKRLTIENKEGTQVKEYGPDDRLNKIEISSKLINQTKLTLELVVEVKNNGTIEGYINQIADYISGFDINLDENKGWYLGDNHNLYNSSLNKQVLKPGETKEFKLILTKNMGENDTGLYKNEAKILDSTNDKQYADDKLNNNSSSVELIISIKTGATKYIILAIMMVLILMIITKVIINKKFKDNKIVKIIDKILIILMVFALVIIALIMNTYADVRITGLTPQKMGFDSFFSSSFTIGETATLATDYGYYATIMCMEGANISNAGYGGRKVVSDVNMMGNQRTGNSVGDLPELTTEGDKIGLLLLEYLGAYVEKIGYGEGEYYYCKHLLGRAINEHREAFERITGIQLGSDISNDNLGTGSTKSAYDAAEAYATAPVATGTENGLTKLDDVETLKYKTKNGNKVYAAIYCNIPEETKILYSIDDGSTFSDYTYDIITQSGERKQFSPADTNKKKFYIPADVVEGFGDVEKVIIRLEGPAAGMRAKLVIFGYNDATGQQQGVLRGKGDVDSLELNLDFEIIPNKPEAKKYLYKVEGEVIPDRSEMSESDKQSRPYPVDANGAELVYKIVVENPKPVDIVVNLTDEFTGKVEYGGLKAKSFPGWTQVADNKYVMNNVTIPAGETKIFEVTLETYNDVLQDTVAVPAEMTPEDLEKLFESVVSFAEYYENRVIITGDVNKISWDWVSVSGGEAIREEPEEPDGQLYKYITAINGEPLEDRYEDRKTLSNKGKYQKPVIVKQGDKVEYTIELHNLSRISNSADGRIYNCDLVDKPESGLSIYSQEGMTGFAVEQGGVHTAKVVLEVKKSNLYLYNVENVVELNHAEYTKKVVYYTSCSKHGSHRHVIYYPNTNVPSSFYYACNKDTIDNTNKDYIRLDELYIAGKVWLDENQNGFIDNGENGIGDIPVNLICLEQETVNLVTGETRNISTYPTRNTDSNGDYRYDKSDMLLKGQKLNFDGLYYPNAGDPRYAAYGDTVTSEYRHYYLDYTYNGVKYISTDVYHNASNLDSTQKPNSSYPTDNNATEYKAARTDFNRYLEIIGYNKGLTADLSEQVKLEFEKNEHISKLTKVIKDEEEMLMKSYSFIDPDNGSSPIPRSNLDTIFLYDGSVDGNNGSDEYLHNINLGLKKRPELDLRLDKDLLEAQVTINGYEMIYDYNQLQGKSKDIYDFPTGDDYLLPIYTTDYLFRKEMYQHEATRNQAKELDVNLKYKITVYNESEKYMDKGKSYDVPVRLEEVLDYYSDEMTMVSAGTGGIDSNNLSFDTSNFKNTEGYSFGGYKTTFIHGDAISETVLKCGDKIEIYVTYNVNKTTEKTTIGDLISKGKVKASLPTDEYKLEEQINTIFARAIEIGKKYTTSQISAYSTRLKDAPIADRAEDFHGLVDIDSNNANINNEGNATIDQIDKYEDNAFRVRAKLELTHVERKITGLVFEDARSEVLQAKMFRGNGIFQGDSRTSELYTQRKIKDPDPVQDLKKDRALENMTVELVEIIKVVEDGEEKIYEETIDPFAYSKVDDCDYKSVRYNAIVKTETSPQGTYEIKSFIPGRYIVRFRYGDIEKVKNEVGDGYVDAISVNAFLHNGQDYKSTTYRNNKDGTAGIESVMSSNFNDSERLKREALTQDTRYNDARDNEYRRLEIMKESQDMYFDKAVAMRYDEYNTDITEIDADGNNKTKYDENRSINLKNLDWKNRKDNRVTVKDFSDWTNGFADTVDFTICIEDETQAEKGTFSYAEKKGRIIYEKIKDLTEIGKLTFETNNIDFGVEYRPENYLELLKVIKSIKLTPSGKTEPLVYIEYDKDGKVLSDDKYRIGIQNVQSVDTINDNQGFRYINVDEEILQGAHLEVEYWILINNIGEADTLSKNAQPAILEMAKIENGIVNTTKESQIISNLGSIEHTESVPGSKTEKIYSRIMIDKPDYQYGSVLGKTYYTGKYDTSTDELVPMTPVTILDFIDNDAEFRRENNSAKDKSWVAKTELELRPIMRNDLRGISDEEKKKLLNYISENGMIEPTNNLDTGEINTERYYKDDENRRYTSKDTENNNHNNLVWNVRNEEENKSLIKALLPKETSLLDNEPSNYYQSYIVVQTDAILGGDKDSSDMNYENVAEILEYISPVGRRTNFSATVGNIEVKCVPNYHPTGSPFTVGTGKSIFSRARAEVDTNITEIIRLTPPTGMTQFGLFIAGNSTTIVTIIGIIVAIVVLLIIRFALYGKVGKTKFYK